MIHYHGTPISGGRAGTVEFASGRHLLIPWKRPDDLSIAMENSRGFIVDNSAYSFWSSGEKPKWEEDIKWCRTFTNHPRFHLAIIRDVVNGT